MPIRANVTVHADFLKGLTPVTPLTQVFDSLDRSALGSFRTTTRWTLYPPESCEGL